MESWAVGFCVEPDDVVGKLLKMAEEHKNCPNGNEISEAAPKPRSPTLADVSSSIERPKRLPRGQALPQKAYERPLLEVLYELGGKAARQKVMDGVEQKMKNQLQAIDREIFPSRGYSRWEHMTDWSRRELVKKVLLKAVNESGRGMWELSQRGIDEVEKG